MKYIHLAILSFIAVVCQAQNEQLIVFTQSSDQLFIDETLPRIKAFAKTEEIAIFEFDAANGIPENITSTPSIIFRNGNGQSIYAGRYTSFSTIKNFVRTARVVRQKATTLDKKDILVLQNSKMKIAAQIKITDIKSKDGSHQDRPDLAGFNSSAYHGIQSALDEFRQMTVAQLEKTDRIFYLDFHPYFVNQDSLILSFELYSQFSCIDPIYKSYTKTIKGSNIKNVFQQAGTILRDEIFKSLKYSTIGDAYSTVSTDSPNKSINEFGIPLPTTQSTIYQEIVPSRSIPTKWKFKAPVNNKLPILQFNFLEPLTRYSGEIESITGSIELDDQSNFISGQFKAMMKTLTMGEDSFDKKVLKDYIKAKNYPHSDFETTTIKNTSPLSWFKTSELTIEGSMNLMKKRRLITVMANITPFIDTNNEAVLLVQANWNMNITDGWKIKGPDGPDPAKKTLQFSLNVLMQPIK